MHKHFPEVRAATRVWVVAADENGLRHGVVSDLMPSTSLLTNFWLKCIAELVTFCLSKLPWTSWRSTLVKERYESQTGSSRASSSSWRTTVLRLAGEPLRSRCGVEFRR